MNDFFKDISFSQARSFAFLKTLLSDNNFGKLPELSPSEVVGTARATENSPDEVRIEYGPKNRLGEYGCHVTLTKTGDLKDRNCFGYYEGDGSRPSLSRGVKRKETQNFLTFFRFASFKPAPILLDTTVVHGTPPMPIMGAQIFLQRMKPDYETPFPEKP